MPPSNPGLSLTKIHNNATDFGAPTSPRHFPNKHQSRPARPPCGHLDLGPRNRPVSSDRNLPGDSFTATLTQPIIADGIVVARRGQTLAGHVTEAVKGGRIKGTSRLGVEIIELSLVDGQQVPVRAQLVQSSAGTSKGRDAGAIDTTTGVGAAIGAVAGAGFGAGMGAIAGAGAAAIGVLVTRGHAPEIYPEEMITFRTVAPITIKTGRSEYAFQPIQQEDYHNTQTPQFVTRPVANFAASPYLL